MAALSPRDRFLATYERNQPWSLPDFLIHYITKNPSPAKCYEKMIQSCKFFFVENPILVVSGLIHQNADNQWITWFNGRRANLTSIPSMIWITDRLYIDNSIATDIGTISSVIIARIYRCDAKEVHLWSLNFNLKDFVFLVSKCETIWLNKVTVLDEDESYVPLVKLFATFVSVKTFYYDFGNIGSKMITSKTVKELIKLASFINLVDIVLINIPESFDIQSFYDYIKENKKAKIYLDFCNPLFEEYTSQLQAIVNEIVADESRDYKTPFIYFPGNDHTAFVKLRELYTQI